MLKKAVKETVKETAKKSAFKIKQQYVDDFLKPYGFDADNLPTYEEFIDSIKMGKNYTLRILSIS